MKKYIFCCLIISAACFVHAQNIEVKKNMLLVDGEECLKIDRKDPNNIGISDLNGNDIIYLKYANDKFGARYNTIVFVNSRSSFTSRQFIYTAKSLVKRLAENHVFENCKLNEAKIENFIARFNENVQIN